MHFGDKLKKLLMKYYSAKNTLNFFKNKFVDSMKFISDYFILLVIYSYYIIQIKFPPSF